MQYRCRRYPGETSDIPGVYEPYTIPHNLPNAPYLPSSDARRRTSADSISNVGNGSLPWEHLPSIMTPMPPLMSDRWMTGQIESTDSRRQFDAWQMRTGMGVNGDEISSRVNPQSPTDYLPMYSASTSSFGDGGGSTTPSNAAGEASPTNATNRASPPPPRPYSCDICGFAFARNHDLTRHVRGHEPAQFGCERCGKAYTRLDSLRRHYVRKRCGPNYTAA